MELETRDLRRHYDALNPALHPHAVCRGCGRIDDVWLRLYPRPLFATAGLTHSPHSAFFVGLAASVGAGISMGLSEALSDDGEVTGRGATFRTRA